MRQDDQHAGGGDSRGRSVDATFARLLGWWTGWAVRRDWADGSHEFVGFRASERGAARFARRDGNYWRRGPWRPTAYAVVAMTRAGFRLHAQVQRCQDAGCPGAQRSAGERIGVAR